MRKVTLAQRWQDRADRWEMNEERCPILYLPLVALAQWLADLLPGPVEWWRDRPEGPGAQNQ